MTKKSISPTMKVLKSNGFVRITYRKGYDHVRDRVMYYPSEGDFSYMKGDGRTYFNLEMRSNEMMEKIEKVLIDNNIKFERERFGNGILKVFY